MLQTALASAFSDDFATARSRFREAAAARGFVVEEFPIGLKGPNGEDLAIDAARVGDDHPGRAVVVSSGLHGIEGFLGSAVQTALLEGELGGWTPGSGSSLVLLHALDPYGFAWLRRFDEHNVDLNRNFLVNGDVYRGAPPRYAELDSLLNPRYSPYRVDSFLLRAAFSVLRHGMANLKQTVAGGQYDFPKGLFFGGHGPSHVQEILRTALPRWLGEATEILHLDFHTGLGAWGDYELLLDEGERPERVARLQEQFGADKVAVSQTNGAFYEATGSLGRWCQYLFSDCDYQFVCAEFGTYSPLLVVEALRAENQAFHWGAADDPATLRAKQRLKEVFAPADPGWRETTVSRGIALVRKAIDSLLDTEPDIESVVAH